MVSDRTEETKLVDAAQSGDMTAFETLMRSHASAVYAHALRFFGDRASAEEVVQEVFIKVHRSLSTFNGQAAFSSWLFRVTRNICLDMLRAGNRRPVPVDPITMVTGFSPDHAPGVIDSVAVEAAMRALAPEDREALNAVALFGMSYAEAGQALGVPVGTVKSRVFRARRTLATLLGLLGDQR